MRRRRRPLRVSGAVWARIDLGPRVPVRRSGLSTRAIAAVGLEVDSCDAAPRVFCVRNNCMISSGDIASVSPIWAASRSSDALRDSARDRPSTWLRPAAATAAALPRPPPRPRLRRSSFGCGSRSRTMSSWTTSPECRLSDSSSPRQRSRFAGSRLGPLASAIESESELWDRESVSELAYGVGGGRGEPLHARCC